MWQWKISVEGMTPCGSLKHLNALNGAITLSISLDLALGGIGKYPMFNSKVDANLNLIIAVITYSILGREYTLLSISSVWV